jgi:colicin import membrane protein
MNAATKMQDEVKPLTPIAEYNQTAAALADLQHRYKDVIFDVSTKDGMATAIKGRAEVRGYRVALEKKRVEIKAPALERARLIDSEAKRISAELSALEDPIDEVIVAEQNRKERERKEREEAEAARIAKIQENLTKLSETAGRYVGKPSAEIATVLETVKAHDVATWAEEFLPAASEAKGRAIATLEQLHAGALAQEQAAAAEARRIADERAELKRLRDEQAERDRTEQARVIEENRKREEAAAEARAKIEAEERASRERIEAQERAAKVAREAEEAKARAERDRIDAAARAEQQRQREEREAEYAKEKAIRDAEEARQAAERKRLADEARALAEQQRAAKEREAAAREVIAQAEREALATDRMIVVLRERIGAKREFSGIAKAIDAYLVTKAPT